VTLYVGEDAVEHKVHKDVLVHYSSFFRNCLSGDMLEQSTSQIQLPEDDNDAFSVFVSWAYGAPIAEPSEALILIKAYVLADKYDIGRSIGYQDQIVDVLSRHYQKKLLVVLDILWVCENVDKRSMMWKFIMDRLSYDMLQYHQEWHERTASFETIEWLTTMEEVMIEGGSWVSEVMSYFAVFVHRWHREERNTTSPLKAPVTEHCRYHMHTSNKENEPGWLCPARRHRIQK
jgi:hypothetical protein